jgi:hypothetical protein
MPPTRQYDIDLSAFAGATNLRIRVFENSIGFEQSRYDC